MPQRIRLHKYLANSGYCSRRRAELLIEAGLVKVNGVTVKQLGTTVDPEKDVVTIHQEVIVPPEPLTIMLNKPPGFLSTTHDTHDRLTVMDLLPRPVKQRGIVPAGRLDRDTCGLLLLTNDGDLLHLITHPRYGCPKEYLVRIDGRFSARAEKALMRGIQLKDGPALPVKILSRRRCGEETEVVLELQEGRKREIKRMFKALGHTVCFLKRTRIGPLGLGDLPEGSWRELTPKEIRTLRHACGTPRARSRRPPQ